ncbi:MAG: hypothetical protein K9L31_01000 [Candidatus Pacebacteria bacterium]|nr:hypothetical protein [Candidatus Paceibacterota bacterium]
MNPIQRINFRANFFNFEELRTGLIISTRDDIAAILGHDPKKSWTNKNLKDIPTTIDEHGPFRVIITDTEGGEVEKTIVHFTEALEFGSGTSDGTHAYISDKDQRSIASVDAT